jgi:hypothetical protein
MAGSQLAELDACEAKQDNKYAKRCAHEFPQNSPSVSGARPVRLGDYTRLSPAGIVGAGCGRVAGLQGTRAGTAGTILWPL